MSKLPFRKERIFKFILEKSQQLLSGELPDTIISGFETTWVSEQLGISRDNVSRELNQLHREKRLLKIHGKPVLFLAIQPVAKYFAKPFSIDTFSNLADFQSMFTPPEKALLTSRPTLLEPITQPAISSPLIQSPDSPFMHLIGYDRSLKTAIKQAKAAILYPPHGLHSLIIGPTGGGKTTLARVMYTYAQQTQRLLPNAPYIIFNCADYAGNPQLLLSHLFGHKKGAFTSASADHMGLVEKANHGILFLDEIHRLPPEGQEMLFSLIDRNQYYRLGDSDNIREAQVLIFAATTERPDTSILQTFLRRIPNLIQLPDLEDRSLDERYDLIKLFFQKETKNMDKEIHVSAEILKLFLIYDCPGNIGQLENDIKLICANAFVNFITEKSSKIHIKLSHLPAQYLKSLDVLATKRTNLNSSFDLNRLTDVSFSPNQPIYAPPEEEPQTNFYQILLNNSKKYFAEDLSLHTIKEIFNNQIMKYFDYTENKETLELAISDETAFLKIISPQIYHLLKESVISIEKDFELKIPPPVFHGLVLHVETMLERIKNHKPLSLPKNNIAINEKDIYYQISTKIIKYLAEHLQIEIPKQEIILISLCLQTLDINKKVAHVGVLVLTHGYYAATDFAEVANRLLGVQHAHGICMPLEEKVSQTLERATKLVEKIDEGKGVLLLADMGSLTTFGDLISNATGIKTNTLRMVTTPMVIEATRKALLPLTTLDQLTHEVETQSNYIGLNVAVPSPTNLIAEKFHFDSEKITKLIENVLVFIDARKAIPVLENVFYDITTQLNYTQEASLYVKFMFHTACMLERSIRNEQLEYKNLQLLLTRHSNIYAVIKDSFSILERTYGITIQDSELGYITEIFAITSINFSLA
ncbi:sigma 54-interacting transcriptional regulator [Propionispira raffinosivorans]|uniref:sigma 54-interacting transcriptional regulator n=1 Tax=Propionispira raffinosivorans TaxID=86959 RepID=UPI00035DA66F|nr:sigma-54-dependent transcriptional regulator [Propionispira raffinosivorans]